MLLAQAFVRKCSHKGAPLPYQRLLGGYGQARCEFKFLLSLIICRFFPQKICGLAMAAMKKSHAVGLSVHGSLSINGPAGLEVTEVFRGAGRPL